jgi:ubiquitin C-terminal hydrolase
MQDHQQLERWSALQSSLSSSNKTSQRRTIEFIKPLKAVNDFRCVQTGSIAKIENISRTSGKITAMPRASNEDVNIGLFPPSLVAMNQKWRTVVRVGPGLYNHGNTCFLNSTLQCLLHTPSLVQILQQNAQEALRGLKKNGESTILEYFQKLVIEAYSTSVKSISPRSMVQNIRRRQFRLSRQEDAHEYLRQLLDCMHEEVLKANGVKVSDGAIAETTFISRIFGGYLCNELRCSVCKYCSTTVNHFQDLSLEVSGGISSVQESLKAFMKTEVLGTGNEWVCGGCNKKVKASKQMLIDTAPRVLVLHLKRFSFGSSFGKINKQIKFEETLVLQSKHGPTTYYLHGLVVHHGSSVHSGHYVAFVKAANGIWHEMNDSSVHVTSVNKVLSQQAYILFYGESEVESTDTKAQVATATAVLSSVLKDVAPTIKTSLTTAKTDMDRPFVSAEMDTSDEETEADEMPFCRLPQMISWNLKPFKFLGNVNKKFGRWKCGKLECIRRPVTPLIDSSPPDGSDAMEVNHVECGTGTEIDDKDVGTKDIVSVMMHEAQRSRLGGSEGIWDHIDEDTLAELKKQTIAQRRDEKQILATRKMRDWDSRLDAGRVKKIKLNDSSEGSSWEELENPFQNISELRDAQGRTTVGGFSQKKSRIDSRDSSRKANRGGRHRGF